MNQDETQDFFQKLYMGTIFVDVGYSSVPTATTATGILGAVDLGGDISVEMLEYLYGDEERGEDDPPLGSVQMWMILLSRMRNMLASCFLLGQMQPVIGTFSYVDVEEDRENLEKAIEMLGEEFFTITPQVALQAVEARHEEDLEFRDGLQAVVEFIDRYREPGENITIEEALKRAKEKQEQDKE
jgi:hypothetical protein